MNWLVIFRREMMVFSLYWVYLFAILLECKANAQNILDYCVDSGLKSSKHQSLIQNFVLRLDVVNNVSEYENEILKDLSEEYVPFMDEEYLEEVAKFLFHRNEVVIDYFWDSMMESLPPSWHVYGTRPIQASVIKTRFMESCASNIYSLFRDGKIEKFHTMISNLKDARYLTLGKVNEICRNIKERIESFGFELKSGVQASGRSSLPAYYRCSEIYSDELADVLILVLDKKIPKLDISKLKICTLVNVIIRDSHTFRESCYGVLSFGLKGYLPIEKDNSDDLLFVCSVMDNIRKFTQLFSQKPIQLSGKGIKSVIVKSLLKIYPNIELTNIGMEMVELMKIQEHRFIESCMNFSETLFALQGFKRITKNVLKQNNDGILDSNEDEINDIQIYPVEGHLKDLRKKLLLTCSGIHMYLFETKPKGVSFTKLRNSRIITSEDFSKISKSKLLILDSCKNEYVMVLGKYTITQDTLSEIILSAILHSSNKSMSSSILHNGVTKEQICNISSKIINLLGKNFLTSPKFEETGFMSSCKQIIIDWALHQSLTTPLNSTLRKSIIKLCSIVTKSLILISETRKSQSGLDETNQDDDELTSSEYISEET
ncbi:uncharacterized protein cubi_02435 [Cryptosporidium ubiquitum]|uniref:Uncharacterized protein n=1 Tax=Cryptosporidium ubiquitum TaxID=857276 RepID=A0A1J4MIC2_9CRYT|nr:uncharacterized protein cubi_02435 [Cryptosporidium ubiquitum]OII73203.1 hypothetical protein cubi_02435 [Cryptosporidium ubiquitum]